MDYIGAVSGVESTAADVTTLGIIVNITARLAAGAGPSEAFITEEASAAAGLDCRHLEHRQVDIKGKTDTDGVYVLREHSEHSHHHHGAEGH